MREDVRIWRDEHGIPHVEAPDQPALYWGQGYVHATDRGLQMLLTRIVAQGRVSEVLDSSDGSLRLDVFFRRMTRAESAARQVETLPPEARRCLESYCDGANAAFSRKSPWELKLLGCRPAPWRPEDSILIGRVLAYAMLAGTQANIERLLVEMVQADVPREKLEELFPGLLGELDVDLVKQVRLVQRVVPPELFWGTAVPRLTASNNWVLSGTKTASGKPILANDPHLEGNRLPAVWSEIAFHWGDRWALGGSMAGTPGILIGRTPDLAWGVTYAFVDAVDSWIERCRDGKCLREPDQWVPFLQRREVILRKKKEPVEIVVYENDHGVLDGDPSREGYYLATRWAAAESGGKSLGQICKMLDVRTVAEGMDVLGRIETAWSFVLADRQGNIGFQMSGLAPRRRQGASGFVPLPGWKKENDWLGFASPEELPRVLNPEQGFFATANQDLNQYGQVKPINAVMAPYRAERILQLLEREKRFTPADMFAMHFDLYSLQAEAFMKILRPLLPDTPHDHPADGARILREWDLRYDVDSRGAFLFEQFYGRLLREVFGKGGLGETAVDYLAAQTGIFIAFHLNFDRVLLAGQSAWFGARSREEVFRQVAVEALAVEPRPWGDTGQYPLQHMLFGGKLPRVLGFDRGPVTVPGGRATIHQMQLYRSGDRVTTFVPSFRMVADLATDELHTNLAGGPSDRRFSKWYCSDLANWLAGKYKAVTPDKTQKRLRFP